MLCEHALCAAVQHMHADFDLCIVHIHRSRLCVPPDVWPRDYISSTQSSANQPVQKYADIQVLCTSRYSMTCEPMTAGHYRLT